MRAKECVHAGIHANSCCTSPSVFEGVKSSETPTGVMTQTSLEGMVKHDALHRCTCLSVQYTARCPSLCTRLDSASQKRCPWKFNRVAVRSFDLQDDNRTGVALIFSFKQQAPQLPINVGNRYRTHMGIRVQRIRPHYSDGYSCAICTILHTCIVTDVDEPSDDKYSSRRPVMPFTPFYFIVVRLVRALFLSALPGPLSLSALRYVFLSIQRRTGREKYGLLLVCLLILVPHVRPSHCEHALVCACANKTSCSRTHVGMPIHGIHRRCNCRTLGLHMYIDITRSMEHRCATGYVEAGDLMCCLSDPHEALQKKRLAADMVPHALRIIRRQ